MFDLTQFNDVSLFLLRLITAIVFISSGWNHLTHYKKNAKDLGLPPTLTLILGAWELLGAASVLLGIYPQIGAIMLIGVMFGAIYKRIFSWHMGFFENHTDGWHYDVIFIIANLVILTTGGGNISLFPG